VNVLWDHAHNDWLQTWIEGGVVATLAVVVLLGLALRNALIARSRNLLTAPWLAAIAAAILAIGLQSAVDFSLRIPAVATLLACLVGWSCAAEADPSMAPPARAFTAGLRQPKKFR
jgi:O-antigen ligase